MSNKLKELRAKEGFTIIEVIIVLVIGAVIMLAVFLVVPQLQRTQRNSRRQADARRVFSAGEQFAANNQGFYPTQSGAPSGTETACTTATALNATNCAPIANITGTVAAPSGTTYNIVNANVATSNTPGVNDMTIIYTPATGSLINCTSSSGGTMTTTAVSSKFVVGVTQETAGSATGSTFCLTS